MQDGERDGNSRNKRKGQEGIRSFVITCTDPAKFFQTTEKALDLVSVLVRCTIIEPLVFPVFRRWNRKISMPVLQISTDFSGSISPVPQDIAPRQVRKLIQ